MVSPNVFSQDMVSCRSARGACVTFRDLIAHCRLAIFAPHPKVKALVERRGRVLRSGTNEGEAERLRGVEIAQRYDLDRV